MDKPWMEVFKATYLSNGNNGTQAYLKAKPHVSLTTAKVEASKLLTTPDMIKALRDETDKPVNKQRFSKEAILDNIDVIRQKTLDKEQYPTSLKANKELAELQGHYERGADDPGQYRTLIQSLIINQTTISSGTPPKQVEHEVDAEYEDVEPPDNKQDNG